MQLIDTQEHQVEITAVQHCRWRRSRRLSLPILTCLCLCWMCLQLTGRAFSALQRLPRLTSLHLMWCSLNHKAFVKVCARVMRELSNPNMQRL